MYHNIKKSLILYKKCHLNKLIATHLKHRCSLSHRNFLRGYLGKNIPTVLIPTLIKYTHIFQKQFQAFCFTVILLFRGKTNVPRRVDICASVLCSAKRGNCELSMVVLRYGTIPVRLSLFGVRDESSSVPLYRQV